MMSSGLNDEANISQANAAGLSQKLQGHLTTPIIIILVMAMVAPIGAFASLFNLGFGLGSGAGMPGTMLIATITMLCFAAGYAAMSRHVKETGAFYAYITKGLGRPAGGAGAFLAFLNYIIAYLALSINSGYFTWTLVMQYADVSFPWWVYTLIYTTIIYFLGRRNIDVSAKVIVVMLLVQIVVIAIFIVAAITHSGGHFYISSFSGSSMFSGGWSGFSIGILFCFFCFQGVEMAAVFAEETKNPEKSVGISTLGAVLTLGILYIILMMCIVAVVGPLDVRGVALSDLGMFVFNLVGQIIGPTMASLVNMLLVVSLVASMIGFQGTLSRYMVAMGRDKLLPETLAYVDPVHKAPQRANLIGTIINTVFILGFAASRLDPFAVIFATISGLTTIGSIALWVTVSLAFIVYFRRHRDKRWLQTCVLPIIALVALSVVLIMVFKNYSFLTGSSLAFVNNLPWIIVPFFAYGIYRMNYLRRKRPEDYAQIWPDEVETTSDGEVS